MNPDLTGSTFPTTTEFDGVFITTKEEAKSTLKFTGNFRLVSSQHDLDFEVGPGSRQYIYEIEANQEVEGKPFVPVVLELNLSPEDFIVDWPLTYEELLAAISLDFGKEIVSDAVKDCTSDEAVILEVPLYVKEDVILTAQCQLYKISPNYAKVILLLSAEPLTGDAVRGMGGWRVEVGAISINDNFTTIKNLISSYMASEIAQYSDRDRFMNLMNRCSEQGHIEGDASLFQEKDKPIIEVLINGICPACDGIERAFNKDIPRD